MLMFSKSVLVVEDDQPKLSAITNFFRENFANWSIEEARSLTSAISKLGATRYDLVVIDMSLPTYDINETTMGGGNPQGFGGEDVIRFTAFEWPDVEMVVITQYDEFQDGDGSSSRSLKEIGQSLSAEIGRNFLGVVSYSGQHGDWQISLTQLLESCPEGGE